MASFDLAKTNTLMELFAAPRNLRDDAWRTAFKEAVIDALTPFSVSHVLGHCTSSGILASGFPKALDPSQFQPL